MSTDQSATPPVHSHGPYPNISLFLLGEWYWNDGERKLQSSFQQLLFFFFLKSTIYIAVYLNSPLSLTRTVRGRRDGSLWCCPGK